MESRQSDSEALVELRTLYRYAGTMNVTRLYARMEELSQQLGYGREYWRAVEDASRTPSGRMPHDYTIEVCIRCGAQLDRSGNGRCPVDRAHWSAGGMVVRVIARQLDDQDDRIAWRRYSCIPDSAKEARRG